MVSKLRLLLKLKKRKNNINIGVQAKKIILRMKTEFS